MPTVTEVVRETFTFSTHEPRSAVAFAPLRDTFFINDTVTVTPFVTVHETFYADDHYVQSAYTLARDTFFIRDHDYPTVHVTNVTRDPFFIQDFISGNNVVIIDVRETFYANDHMLSPPSASLRETFRIDDRLYWSGTGTGNLRETFKIRDAAYPHTSVVLREQFFISDDYSDFLRNIVTTREKFFVDDAVYPQNHARGASTVLRETFFIDDNTAVTVVWGGGALLRETFYIDDRAILPPLGLAYTAHIVNWGMSTYQNFPFLTQAGNYAAGQNLWRLDAVKDHMAPIAAWITMPQHDLGTSHGKRPSAFYAAGSTSEPLSLTVTGDVHGQLNSFDYVLDLRDQTNYRNNRAILGKGFRSRYLQFKLGAPKYTGFRLLTAELDIAMSPRRVG